MEIESYSYSGQDPRSDPLCNTTCKLWCADIDLAQTESWLARQVSCSTADWRVSAPPLAQTADALNVSLLYHRGHLQPPRHLSVGRRAAWPRVDALSVCPRCRLFNYLPRCRHWSEDYKSKSSQFRGKRRHLTWVACPVAGHGAQWAELELRPDLDIAPAVSCVYTWHRLLPPWSSRWIRALHSWSAGCRWFTRPRPECLSGFWSSGL